MSVLDHRLLDRGWHSIHQRKNQMIYQPARSRSWKLTGTQQEQRVKLQEKVVVIHISNRMTRNNSNSIQTEHHIFYLSLVTLPRQVNILPICTACFPHQQHVLLGFLTVHIQSTGTIDSVVIHFTYLSSLVSTPGATTIYFNYSYPFPNVLKSLLIYFPASVLAA